MSPFYVIPILNVKYTAHKIILPNIFLISDRPSRGLIFYLFYIYTFTLYLFILHTQPPCYIADIYVYSGDTLRGFSLTSISNTYLALLYISTLRLIWK